MTKNTFRLKSLVLFPKSRNFALSYHTYTVPCPYTACSFAVQCMVMVFKTPSQGTPGLIHLRCSPAHQDDQDCGSLYRRPGPCLPSVCHVLQGGSCLGLGRLSSLQCYQDTRLLQTTSCQVLRNSLGKGSLWGEGCEGLWGTGLGVLSSL